MWLTPQNNSWNPYDPEYAALEASHLNADGDMRMMYPGKLRDTSPSDLLVQVSSVVTTDHVYKTMMHTDEYKLMVSKACSNNSVEIGAFSSDEVYKRSALMAPSGFDPWFGTSPFASVGVLSSSLTAGTMIITPTPQLLHSLYLMMKEYSRLQHNQFAMALGATYCDSPADNDLFVALE